MRWTLQGNRVNWKGGTLGSGGDIYSPQYRTVYDAFLVKPADDVAIQQDIMVRRNVTAGIWATRDVFYITANNTQANSNLNWINPGTFTLLPVGAPAWVQYRGYTGGAGQYLNTQYNPAVDAINFALDDSSIGAYIRTNINANCAIGCSVGANALILYPRHGGSLIANVNDAVGFSIVNANSLGLHIANRTAANARSIYKNAAPLGGDAQVSTAIPNAVIYLLGRNNAGVLNDPCGGEESMAQAGASLDEVGNNEITIMTNAVETYMDYIGAGVIP